MATTAESINVKLTANITDFNRDLAAAATAAERAEKRIVQAAPGTASPSQRQTERTTPLTSVKRPSLFAVQYT